MTFLEILPEFLKGKKIREKFWASCQWIQLDDVDTVLNNLGGRAKFLEWRAMLAGDWELYSELHYFNWAIAQLRDGKKVQYENWAPHEYIEWQTTDNQIWRQVSSGYSVPWSPLLKEMRETKKWRIYEED